MKALFGTLLVACVLWLGGCIRAAVLADYEYSEQIESFWELSVKASTIEQKSVYLDKYVAALEQADLADSDALWLKTPDNNTRQNMIALESLQGRMHEIIHMDLNSFQY